MLLDYGNTHCDLNWKVDEKTSVGYSRVYYVYSGEVFYTDEHIKSYLKPQHLYIFPSTLSYKIKQNINNRLHCTYMHIDFFPSIINELIEIPLLTNLTLKNILCSIREAITSNDPVIINSLSEVFKLYCTNHSIVDMPDDQISSILIYISNNIKKKITIKELSQIAGYNTQYFVRLFKKRVGISPYRYIINYRLKEAKKLLKQGNTISQIARNTGYNDIKSFSRSFKRNFGISPSSYRNNYSNQP